MFLVLCSSVNHQILNAQIVRGVVKFLSSGSSPAAGVDISAFGANPDVTTSSGMFELTFPNKRPGDKIKIIPGTKDGNSTSIEVVNDKELAQARIPSNPDDDVLEIIVCKRGYRDEAAIRYNGIIVKNVNEKYEKNIREINAKLEKQGIDILTIESLQKEKENLRIERDSILARADELSMYIANINTDKAYRLVVEAISKIDSTKDFTNAIEILNNDLLLKVYEEAKIKKQKANTEIIQIINAFQLKINLLSSNFNNLELNNCCLELERICKEQDYDIEGGHQCFDWTTLDGRDIQRWEATPLSTPNEAGKICIEGNRLYIVVPLHGFSIYDISDTRAPKEIRFVALSGIVDIAARGEFIYANQYMDLVLIKVPINSQQEIIVIKRLINAFPSRRSDQIEELSEFANFNTYKKHLANYDQYAGIVPSTSVNGSMSCMTIIGDFIYTVDGNVLKTFNAKPTSADLFECINTINLSEDLLETVWTDGGTRLYLGSQTGLHIFDNTNRAEPKLLGSYRHRRSCDPVVVVGNIAYSTQRDGKDCAGGVNQLDVVDISNPSRPYRIRNYPLTNPHGLAVSNDMVMVCDGRDGLRIFNASNPSNLQEISRTSGIMAYDVLYDDGKKFAFVSIPNQIKIYSVAQKTNPILQSTIVLPWIKN